MDINYQVMEVPSKYLPTNVNIRTNAASNGLPEKSLLLQGYREVDVNQVSLATNLVPSRGFVWPYGPLQGQNVRVPTCPMVKTDDCVTLLHIP